MNAPITQEHRRAGLRHFRKVFGPEVAIDANDQFVKPFAHIRDVYPVGYIGHFEGAVALVDRTGDSDKIVRIFARGEA